MSHGRRGTREHALRLNRDDLIVSLALIIATILTRVPFRSAYLYSWDSANYAFALRRFDVMHEAPQPPGYIVYVWLARLVDPLVHDANAAMVWISIVASALAMAALFLLGAELFDRRAGLIAALLLLSSPMFWFYGEVALPHPVDLFLVLLCVWALYRVRVGETAWIWPAAIVLGVAAGVREQTLFFLLPLAVYCVWRVDWPRLAGATGALAAVCVAWFVPLVSSTGGITRYLDKNGSYSARFDRTTSLFAGTGLAGPEGNVRKLALYTLFGLGAALVPLVVWAVVRLVRRRRAPAGAVAAAGARRRHDLFVFFGLWLLPALLFYVLVHMGQQGMVFIFLPIPLLLAAAALAHLTRGRTTWIALAALVGLNAAVFTLVPEHPPGLASLRFPTSQAIANSDRFFRERLALIGQRFPRGSTAVVAGDWRQLAYYLPGYHMLRLGAENDAAGRGAPVGWPGGGSLSASDLGMPSGATLVLVDPEATDLFARTPGVETIALPTSGSVGVLPLGPGARLRYDPSPPAVQ